MSGFSDLAAAYSLHNGPEIHQWQTRRQNPLGDLLQTLAPIMEQMFAQKRQDKIAEALMTGTAPRATAVTDASGQSIVHGGGADAQTVDAWNSTIPGAATSADVFQGSPTDKLRLASIIQGKRDEEQAGKMQAIKEGLQMQKLSNDVNGTGPTKGGAGPGYVDTPYGRMTAHQWSLHPANPDAVKPKKEVDPLQQFNKQTQAQFGLSPADLASVNTTQAYDPNNLSTVKYEDAAGQQISSADAAKLGDNAFASTVVGTRHVRVPLPQWNNLLQKRQQLTSGQTQASLTNGPQPQSTGSSQYPNGVNATGGSRDVVTRTTQDGRKALFDAQTKEFIQYVQ